MCLGMAQEAYPEPAEKPHKLIMPHTKTGAMHWMIWIPSGKLLHNSGKSPFLMDKSTINSHAVMFNSYVKLAEGMQETS